MLICPYANLIEDSLITPLLPCVLMRQAMKHKNKQWSKGRKKWSGNRSTLLCIFCLDVFARIFSCLENIKVCLRLLLLLVTCFSSIWMNAFIGLKTRLKSTFISSYNRDWSL